MKRVVSILLAATLMLTSGTVTYATEEKSCTNGISD